MTKEFSVTVTVTKNFFTVTVTVTVTKKFFTVTVTVMRIFVPGDGDGEKKHDYTVPFTGAGYVSPLVPA